MLRPDEARSAEVELQVSLLSSRDLAFLVLEIDGFRFV